MISLDFDGLKFLKGATARLWRFSPSHDMFVYRIQTNDKDPDQEKYLIFTHCDNIEISIFWKIVNPKIIKDGDFYIIEDNQVKITCQGVFFENGYTLEYFNEKYGNNQDDI